MLKRPRSITALSILFLVYGSVFVGGGIWALFGPGWTMKSMKVITGQVLPEVQFSPLGAAIYSWALGIPCLLIAYGLFKMKPWGRVSAIVLLLFVTIYNAVLIRPQWQAGFFDYIILGALILWLLKPSTKMLFHQDGGLA